MKKIFLFLLLFSSVIIFGITYTETEKKVILKQFTVFQKAVKNKDSDTLEKMMNSSMDDYENLTFETLSDVNLLKIDLAKSKVKNFSKKDSCNFKVSGKFIENDDFTQGNAFRVMSGPSYDEESEGCTLYKYFYFRLEGKDLILDESVFYSG